MAEIGKKQDKQRIKEALLKRALGYDYEHTGAQIDDKIVGLVLDENNHSDLTDRRIAEWTSKVESEYAE